MCFYCAPLRISSEQTFISAKKIRMEMTMHQKNQVRLIFCVQGCPKINGHLEDLKSFFLKALQALK